MIDSEAFKQLNLRRQVKLLYEEGTFVVAIRYYGYKINLYLLNNYYVEVFYNHKHDLIEKIDLLQMRNNTRMKFYSDQVRLPVDI